MLPPNSLFLITPNQKLDVGGPRIKDLNYNVIPVGIMYNTAFVICTLEWATVN